MGEEQMDKKKITAAFIVREFPKLSETFILNQIIGLLESGCDVDIFAFEKEGENMKFHERINTYHLLERTYYFPKLPSGRTARLWGALKIFLKYGWARPQVFKKWMAIEKGDRLNRLFRLEPFLRKKYDIVHCQFGPQGRNFVFLKEVLDLKIVTAFRGYDISKLVHDHPDGFYNHLFEKGDLFVPVCEHFRNRLLSLNCPPDRTKVLYSGIDTEKFSFGERTFDLKQGLKVLSVGRLAEKKGIEFGIRAIGQALKTIPDLQYTIIGSGEEKEKLVQLAENLGIAEHVHFIDYVIDTEINKLYHVADLFLLPCVTAGDLDQEGIPNVLKEAMATGMPVISTRHSGIPELIEDGINGALVDERDVDALAGKIIDLAGRPEACREMGQAARKTVEQRFDSNRLNIRLKEMYQEILSIQ